MSLDTVDKSKAAYFSAIFETSGNIYNDMNEERKYLTISIIPRKTFDTALRSGHKLWGGELLNDPNNHERDEKLWYEKFGIDPAHPRVKAGNIPKKYEQKEMEWKLSAVEAEKFLSDIAPYLLISRKEKIASIREIARFWDKELFRCLRCHKIFDDRKDFVRHREVHQKRVLQ